MGQPKEPAAGDSQAMGDGSHVKLAWWESFRLRLPEGLVDWIWPSARPFTPEERREEYDKKQKRKKEVDECIEHWDRLRNNAKNTRGEVERILAVEEKRRDSVQTRLGYVFGMALIAASVTFAIAGLVLHKSAPATPNGFLWVLWIAGVYVASQFMIAVVAAVTGHQRASGTQLTAAEIFPRCGEEDSARNKRIARVLLDRIEDVQESTNRCVTQMAIAHTAVRNACVGIVFTSLILGAAIIWRAPVAVDWDAQQITKQIRSDKSLADLLRGPRGVQGPRGQRGEKGDPGVKCECDPCGLPVPIPQAQEMQGDRLRPETRTEASPVETKVSDDHTPSD